jgi:hypothetical protein
VQIQKLTAHFQNDLAVNPACARLGAPATPTPSKLVSRSHRGFVALQHGAELEAIHGALCRGNDGRASGSLGTALDELERGG